MEEIMLNVILGGIIDTILLVLVGLGLLGINVKKEHYSKIMPLYIIAVYIFTVQIDLNGFHPFVLFFVLSILIKFIVEIDFVFSSIAVLLSFLTIYISETFFVLIFHTHLGFSLEQMREPIAPFIVFYLLSRATMIIITLIIHNFDINLIDLSGVKNGGK